ncbi:MAG TPA: Gfo/Idh/MocA family oxidoreductase [Opitutaceae bacterium]|nr:Gfo/Idh/MocA family oxidoreductase [Opitutaceae bacterium]
MNGICIVGYGYWGPKLVRNFLQAAGGRPVAVCDESPDRLARARKEFPGVTTLASFDQVLKDPAFDAVALATPVSTHHPLARQALQAGRHVLVEKPLTSSLAAARELVALAERQQRVLMVDHTFVYHPAVQKIKALIGAGELGQLRYIDSTRINLGLFQHDVNVLWDLAVHDISIVNHLTPERPLAVSAVATAHTPGAPENIGFIVLRYASGLVVHLNCSWVSPVKIRHILIGGDRKMILYNDLDANEPLKVYDSGYQAKTDEERNRLLFDYRVGDVYSPKIPAREALAALAADFVEAASKGRPPVSDGRFGADVVAILEAAHQSVRLRGQEVPLG